MSDFKMIFQKADVNNINAYLKLSTVIDVEIDTAQMEVKFSADIEFRSQGINGITATVRSVIGWIEWYVYPDGLLQGDILAIQAAGGVEMRNGNFEGKFEVDSSWEIKDDDLIIEDKGYLFVSEVEIDCKTKRINVS